jgi:glycosyltransferase involved in cell wall biosynthesis
MMKFSVLISIYNKENIEYFNNAMESIWDDQILKPNEIILVQDGELTDALYKSIDKWKRKLDHILKIIPLKDNVGLGNALNIGLRECSHELVARMDTDDISTADRFKKQIDCFSSDERLDIIGSFATLIDENGILGDMRKMPIDHKSIYDNLFACPFIHPSVMFKKSSIVNVGGYNKSLIRRQDYDLWFKCAKADMKFFNIAEPLILYRFTPNTHNRQTFKVMMKQSLIGYKGVLSINQPYWKAIACFVPLIRSLLPMKIQHYLYLFMKKIDPRQK